MADENQIPEAAPSRPRFRRSRLPGVVVIALGTLISILLYSYVRSWGRERAGLEFVMRAQTEAGVVRQTVGRTLESFGALRPFKPLPEGVELETPPGYLSARDFNTYIKRPLSKQPGLRGVAWIPQVRATDRTDYVGLVRANDYTDFQLLDLDRRGRKVRAGRRPVYYPVHHIEFYDGSTGTHGLDVGTDATQLAAINSARITGQAVLQVASENPVRMALVQPIYQQVLDSDDLSRQREPVGYVMGLFDLEMMIKEALINLDDPRVAFTLYKGSLESGIPLYAQGESGDEPAGQRGRGVSGRPDHLSWATPLDAASQHWTLFFYPTADYFQAGGLWSPWQILVAGILISILLGIHLLDIGNRNAVVEKLVVERTAELSKANIDLQKEVSERRRVVEELRKISRAVEQSANMVIITDTRGLIEYVNPRFVEITGYASEEVVGQSPKLLATEGTSKEDQAALAQALELGREWQGMFHNAKKDGTGYLAAATISPIRNDDGVITHFLSIQVDMTEQKKLEAQFLQAQKMEVVGRLVGGIAHDFNNILTTILGFGQLFLRRMEADHWMRSGLEEMVHAAERASSLTKQLLTFARTRDQSKNRTNLKLNSVLTNMEKLVRRALGEDVELVVLLDDEIGAISADQGQLEQVVMNLAVNARDAMPEGGKLVVRTRTVELEKEYCHGRLVLDPGRYTMLSVSDSGSGMSAQVLEHVFEPFYTTKDPGKGTGLGLSTVFGIVRGFDGDIEVYSEEGSGTEFKIYFPEVAALGDEVQRRAAAEPPRGQETILVVEDDEAVRKVTVMVLKELGYQVFQASHGEEALEFCQSQNGTIDLLVVDVVMPRMSGPVLVRKLRELDMNYRLIYTSGFTDHPSLKERADLGDVRFIEKPFTREVLGKAVREVLDEV